MRHKQDLIVNSNKEGEKNKGRGILKLFSPALHFTASSRWRENNPSRLQFASAHIWHTIFYMLCSPCGDIRTCEHVKAPPQSYLPYRSTLTLLSPDIIQNMGMYSRTQHDWDIPTIDWARSIIHPWHFVCWWTPERPETAQITWAKRRNEGPTTFHKFGEFLSPRLGSAWNSPSWIISTADKLLYPHISECLIKNIKSRSQPLSLYIDKLHFSKKHSIAELKLFFFTLEFWVKFCRIQQSQLQHFVQK